MDTSINFQIILICVFKDIVNLSFVVLMLDRYDVFPLSAYKPSADFFVLVVVLVFFFF